MPAVETADLTEDQLLNMAQSFDGSGEYEEPESTPTEEARDSSSTEQPESTTAATQAGDADKPEPEGSSTEVLAEEAKGNESNYQKAQKEQARRDKSWKALEAEKAEFRQQQAQFQQEQAQLRAQIEQMRTEMAQAKAPAKPEHSAEDWENFARSQERKATQLERNGNYEGADEARAMADSARQRAEKARAEAAKPQTPSQPTYALDFTEAEWKAASEQYIGQNPDLRTPSTELYQKTDALLKQYPIFTRHRDGVAFAAEVAKLQISSARSSALEAQVETLKKENERLTNATSLSGSNATRPAGPKNFDDMSLAEQDRELQRMTLEHDRSR